jgi:hypothetical protein
MQCDPPASSDSSQQILPKIGSQNSWNRNWTDVFYWLVWCALRMKLVYILPELSEKTNLQF